MNDLRSELKQLRLELDLIQKVYCSKDEEKKCRKLEKEKQPLPEDVRSDDTGYFRYVETDLSEEELQQLLHFRQLSYLKSIRNSMSFFVVLTIISVLILLAIAVR